jgi:hypothetical protein
MPRAKGRKPGRRDISIVLVLVAISHAITAIKLAYHPRRASGYDTITFGKWFVHH